MPGWLLVGNRTEKTIGEITVSCTVPSTNNRMSSWTASASSNIVALVDVYGKSSETVGLNSALGQLWVSNVVKRSAQASSTNFWRLSLPAGSGSQNIVAAIGDVAGNVGYATNTVTVRAVTNATYGHNSAGCITNITYTGANYGWTNDIAWNQQYQVTSFTTNGTTAETFAYDALGRRVKRVADGVTNWFVHDGIHPVAEVDDNGNLQKSYTWGPGIDNLLAYTDHTTTNTYYMITDHLGTVHAVANSSGSVVESYRYDAFGRVLGVYDGNDSPIEESAIGNNYLWQGRHYSWKTGLYYFRARWYDAVTGRWLSKDPIGIAGGLNQYVFAENNPVNMRDPLGLEGGGLLIGEWLEDHRRKMAPQQALMVEQAVERGLTALGVPQSPDNITSAYPDFARVNDPSFTEGWTPSHSIHADKALESPAIPGVSPETRLKYYEDPKRGNVIAPVSPTDSKRHRSDAIDWLLGGNPNLRNAKEIINDLQNSPYTDYCGGK